jgi:hypothetical protein
MAVLGSHGGFWGRDEWAFRLMMCFKRFIIYSYSV